MENLRQESQPEEADIKSPETKKPENIEDLTSKVTLEEKAESFKRFVRRDMENAEEQPEIPELGKKQEDEFTAAKKRMENYKQQFQQPVELKTEDEPKVEPEKKSAIEVFERVGQARTAEQVEEFQRIRETEEIGEAEGIKKEKIKDELIETAKKIEEAREKKQEEAENNLYERAVEPYREITGENLKERAKEKAKIEAEKEGLRFMTKQEFLSPERIKNTEEKVRQRQWSEAILYRWNNLSDEERLRYVDENGKQNIGKFATELEGKRQGLEKKGINLSRDAYYQMMKEGLQPDQMKVRGFWGRIFIGPEIEAPSLYWKKPLDISKKELGNWATKAEAKSIDYAKREAQRELEQKVAEGQKRWKEKKQKCTRDLIEEVAQKIELERRAKEEAKKKERRPRGYPGYPEKPKIELFSRVGKERTPQQIKEMERIRKQVEADIKRRKEMQKKIQDLIKKRKKNKLLTAKEIAYLNSFAEEEGKRAA